MFVTAYSKTVKRRKTGRVETVACAYRTNSLTSMHEHIRKTYPGAKTYEDPKQVFTEFCCGIPLTKPIVVGGKLVE